jgi:hypothetical protein
MANALVYYCFGNASPIDLTHNPILSISSLRKYNQTIPVVVLTCEANELLFKPYSTILNFQIQRFTARHDKHQLSFKAADCWQFLVDTGLDDIIVCDTDVVWHSDVELIRSTWLNTNKAIMLKRNLNTGLFGFVRERTPDLFLKTWFTLCYLLSLHGHDIVTDTMLKEHYGAPDIHDESALELTRFLLDRFDYHIYKYDNNYCYSPGLLADGSPFQAKNMHYMLGPLKKFVAYRYENNIIFDRIGRTGLLLSVQEYYDMVAEQLGNSFPSFINKIPLLHRREAINDFFKKYYYFVNYVLFRNLIA